jgi:adenosylcobinamide kinase/adenosylcobinamide-phosphate guanylyltransferase
MKHLVLGGARSGKSHFAESCAQKTGKILHYIATAQGLDAEMQARIERHRAKRTDDWILHEEPLALADTLATLDGAEHCILVDCLTLWLSNCLAAGSWDEHRKNFLSLLPNLSAELILISNEVGNGIVPLGEVSRQFVDESGWLHQQLADRCDRVTLVIAGLPQSLKGEPAP